MRRSLSVVTTGTAGVERDPGELDEAPAPTSERAAESASGADASAPPPAGRGRSLWWVGVLLVLLLVFGIDATWELGTWEPLHLRWIRRAVEHPVHLACGFALLGIALRRGRPLPTRQSRR